MLVEGSKKIALVLDDAERTVRDTQALAAVLQAIGRGAYLELSVNIIAALDDKTALKQLSGLPCPLGLHLDFDSQGGLLHRARVLSERVHTPLTIRLMNRLFDTENLSTQVQQHIDQQYELFHLELEREPTHLTLHNGWWNISEVMRPYITFGERNRLPMRVARQYMTISTPPSLCETGLVIDEHNREESRERHSQSLNPHTFSTFLIAKLGSRTKAEVPMHIRSDDNTYARQRDLIADQNFVTSLRSVGIALVSPARLIQ